MTMPQPATTNHSQISLWGYQPAQDHGQRQQSAQPQISLHGYQPDQQIIDQVLGIKQPTAKPQR